MLVSPVQPKPRRSSVRQFVLGLALVAVILWGGLRAVRAWRAPASASPRRTASGLVLIQPLDGTLFPPDLAPPLLRWRDDTGADRWRLEVKQGEELLGAPVEVDRSEWRPESALWERWKAVSRDRAAQLTVTGFRRAAPDRPLAQTRATFRTSSDPVSDPILYREVNLPFLDAVRDPAKISWRFGGVDQSAVPPVVLTGMPVCGNCHSASRDGAVLAMDVDYANSKGSYVIAGVAPRMELRPQNVISWDDFRREDGQQTFGLLSQISPDAEWVVSTVKDRSVFVPRPDLEFSQLFFPVQGILALYHRPTRTFQALPGADDPARVQSNPAWSPDGQWLVFARSDAYRLRSTSGGVLLRPEDCAEFLEGGEPFRFDLYRLPFNGGRGGQPEPLRGASGNGRSNFFGRYSPDGRWIVFCQARNYMLLQPDSELFIVPAEGGEPRRLRANLGRMNSWHSWSANSRWLVFSSKANGPYTQLYLTHIDAQGESTPPVWLDRFTTAERAANIPEFVHAPAHAIESIRAEFLNDYSYARAGFVCESTGDVDGALRQYRRALELNPDNAHAHERLGHLLCEARGDWAGGLAECRRAVECGPDNGQARFYLAKALLTTGRGDDALTEVGRALELLPRSAVTDAEYTRANLRQLEGFIWGQKGDFARAATALDEATRLNPTNAMLQFTYAVVLAQQGKIEEPLEAFQRAARLDAAVDRQPLVYELVARNCEMAGQWADATRWAEEALKRSQASGSGADVQRLRQALDRYRSSAH